jgi:hypothetical protein
VSTTDETKASARTDQELSDAVLGGLRADAEQEDRSVFDESVVMTGGTRVDEVKADRDVILRDQINNNYLGGPDADREPAPLTVGRVVIGEVREAFVPPDDFVQLSLKEPLLLLRVPAGRGGGSAGIRLLLDSGAATVKELASDVALRRLTADRLEDRSGYLLRNAAETVLNELTEHEIGRLCEALRDGRCHLVITVDPQVRFPESLLSKYIADLGEPPAARKVLAAHLRHRLRRTDPDGRRTDEIGNDPTVLEMLADSAGREDRVSRAAWFAGILADAEQAGAFDLDKISEQLRRITTVSFEGWFDYLEFSDRCFAVALAALPGYSYEIVAGAATDLERALRPPVPPTPGAGPPDPFATRRSTQLDRVLARVSTRPVTTRYGVTPMEVVAFIDPSLSRQILDRVWTEYAGTRPVLLDWLRGLTRHGVLAVRQGAARAVGVLAAQAFDYVRRYVIGPWALSTDSRDRQAAAAALSAPAREATVSLATRRMLHDWHLDRSPATLRNTAARAYGQVGLVDIDEALDGLAHLATDEGDHLVQVIANSMTVLLVNGDEEVALQVLRRLEFWTSSPSIEPPEGSARAQRGVTGPEAAEDKRSRLFAAYYSFLNTAMDARLVNRVGDRPDAVAWHGLLWLADRNAAIAEVMSRLWNSAVNNALAYEGARTVLTSWAARIDEDSRGRTAFAQQMASVASRSTRARNTLLSLVRSWRSDRDLRAPKAAEAVLAALNQPAAPNQQAAPNQPAALNEQGEHHDAE